MRETADLGRDVDRIYRAFRGAAVRFGESKIKSRRMSNGRTIYYPSSWDEEPGREERERERDRRLAEIEATL
jgi:hypothetical protein